MMRKLFFLMLPTILFVVACGGSDETGGETTDIPTLAAPASVEDAGLEMSEGEGMESADGSAEEAPRASDDSSLPPTFTPAPTTERELVPTVELELNDQGTPVPVTAGGPSSGPTLSGTDGEAGTYTVKKGDTLAEIAAAFNVSVDDLAQANNIVDIDVIEVGDVLVIP